MLSIWTKHLKDPKNKEDFEREIVGCSRVLQRLSEIITEMEKESDRSELDIKSYDNPNWSHRAAHKIGSRAALTKVKDLINLDQQNKD